MSSLEIILGTPLPNIANSLVSDKSQFGYVYLFDYNGNKFVLKIAVITNDESSDDPILPIPYEYTEEGKEFSIQKRIDLKRNFMNEVTIQNHVYHTSYNKPLCPKLNDFYLIDDFGDQISFLVKLQQISDEKSKNTIDNLLKNIFFKFEKKYKLGVISMEYTDGYIPLSTFIQELNDNDKQIIYENVIFQAIRLFNETNQIHCDLNYGNIMVKTIDDILFLDFARMKHDNRMSFIHNFNKNDIENIIKVIIEVDDNYHQNIDLLHRSIFKAHIIDILDKIDSEKKYYENIAKKLNEYYSIERTNKNNNEIHKFNVDTGDISRVVDQSIVNEKIGDINSYINENRRNYLPSPPKRQKRRFGNSIEDNPESRESRLHTSIFDFMDEDSGSDSDMGISNSKGIGLFGPPSPDTNSKGFGLFGPPSPEANSNENMSPNIFSFNLGNPQTPPQKKLGGVKKSKKQKRKPLHQNKSKKTRKNKSNKKRVKLISKK
jgi:hypothetical protein